MDGAGVDGQLKADEIDGTNVTGGVLRSILKNVAKVAASRGVGSLPLHPKTLSKGPIYLTHSLGSFGAQKPHCEFARRCLRQRAPCWSVGPIRASAGDTNV
jgi:hypothetical protein